MSGSLLEIRKRIGSVKNTRKITKAMQLVAASKMRQFQKRAVTTRRYVWDLIALLEENLHVESSYTEKREKGEVLFVLYTSDKGLCGPLNNKLINGLFRSERWNALTESQRMLITFGKKGYDFARNNGIHVDKHFVGVPEKMNNVEAIKLVDEILNFWRSGAAKEIVLIAPHYKNSFTFYPVLKTFLPFDRDMVETNIGTEENKHRPARSAAYKKEGLMIYEPSKEHVVSRLHEQVVFSLFLESFLELKASEYSSRMMAMQSATDAADKITNELSLQYNKARQQAITQEIAELVGASAAISN
ncbi:MAG: ATP synthase gamma chain [Candidatus Peregrinibacteria bacterium GW2011_GWA2_47_7]|nr:MAG: ATP synthase gamma chain [Candidatus Peregrinibacteria bacterium GW2011_GWA2_47_7]